MLNMFFKILLLYLLEVRFKSNSTSQNRFVRWGLHPCLYIMKLSSL